jgi:hypothetical protein
MLPAHPRRTSPYICPGKSRDSRPVNISKPWLGKMDPWRSQFRIVKPG